MQDLYMTKKQQNGLILILGSVAALGPFSIDMYLPGFPAIAEDLNTDISKVALTLTSYFVGISVGQLIYGPILDRYGRKKPLLIGMVIYIMAVLGCAAAPDVYSLIALRALMALGGCVGMVASRAIIRDRFPVSEIARVFSTLILVMGVAPIVAPTLGGLVISNFNWRFVFIFLAILSTIVTFLIFRFLEESHAPDKEVSLRPNRVAIEYWKVLSNSTFLVYGLAGSLAMAAMFAYIGDSSFVLMELYGFSEQSYGWIFGSNAAGFIIGSQVNRYILKKREPKVITYVFAILMVGVALSLALGNMYALMSMPVLISLLFLFMFFLGFVNPNTQALALEPFSKNAGIASALVGSLRMFSGAVATALISIFHDGSIKPMVWIICICALLSLALLVTKRKEIVLYPVRTKV